MSDRDSFISEVSEEVRRDRLFRLIRKYGWIAVLLVVVLVAAAAVFEYRRAQDRAQAEEFGDAIVAALDLGTPEARRAALAEIPAQGTQAALIAMLSADTLDTTAAEADTAARLDALADNAEMPQLYRDLAILKSAMLADGDVEPQALIDRLDPLTIPGAPFRLLAQEQQALALVALDDANGAIALLQGIVSDTEATRDLTTRARQLVVALGGSLDAT